MKSFLKIACWVIFFLTSVGVSLFYVFTGMQKYFETDANGYSALLEVRQQIDAHPSDKRYDVWRNYLDEVTKDNYVSVYEFNQFVELNEKMRKENIIYDLKEGYKNEAMVP